MVTVQALHFLRKNPESSEKSLWAHLQKVFSFEDKASEDDLVNHHGLIQKFMEKDTELAKCPLLPLFLEERSTKKLSSEDNPTSKKTFIADDDEVIRDDDGDDSEEETDMFDSVCAICDNGGELLCCEGRCLRSFHATKSAGEDTDCKSLGYTKSQVEAIQNFLCRNCKYKKHQCFICGRLGSSDKSAGAEVFICVKATCGRFYHPKCVARLLHRGNETEATDCQKKIAAGETFTCPIHTCVVCGEVEKTGEKGDKDNQFAMCRRCPKSYHRRCLPREIAFDDIEEEDIIQRAWDDLLPNRILIYCLDHDIDEDLGTPVRNHIKFPELPENKKLLITQKSKVNELVKKKRMDSDSLPTKNRFPDSGGLPRKKKSPDYEKLPMDQNYVKPKKVIQHKLSDAEEGYPSKKRDKATSEQVPESNKRMRLTKEGAKSVSWKDDVTVLGDSKASLKEKAKPLASAVPPTSYPKRSSFPVITEETEKKMKALMEESSSSITLDGIIKKRTVPSTHAFSGRHIDKSITQGKVEGAVEAVRAAIKKLEDGGSIEDAKAVCEPEVLRQLLKWSSKLRVYLSPFLHGVRYSSFGRHFTLVGKLMEIVDKLQWYVQSGDTIVDFCCGANDFSQLMKEKLEETGKKCFFKNYDIIQPKNDFNFEQRDWMTVQPKELPTGSQLIMGLNPPFGVKASLANKFIDKALTFRPKLIILIVPPETERLDEKKTKYDLIWEDRDKLAGKSFYLPGSVDVNDKQIEQWNNTPPPLYLWSRSDWTAKHMSIAAKQGHIDTEEQELDKPPTEDAPSERTISAPPVEVHTESRDDTVGGKPMKESNQNSSDLTPSKKSGRRRGKKHRKEDCNQTKGDEDSDMSISPSEGKDNQSGSTAVDEDISHIVKRYTTLHSGSVDYGMQSSDERFSGGRYSLSSSVTGMDQPGHYVSPSFASSGSSAMQRYAPRLGEANYTRPVGSSLPGGSSLYGMSRMSSDTTTDIMGFAPSPRLPFPRPGSSGWIND